MKDLQGSHLETGVPLCTDVNFRMLGSSSLISGTPNRIIRRTRKLYVRRYTPNITR